jgi:hypothetical protein
LEDEETATLALAQTTPENKDHSPLSNIEATDRDSSTAVGTRWKSVVWCDALFLRQRFSMTMKTSLAIRQQFQHVVLLMDMRKVVR